MNRKFFHYIYINIFLDIIGLYWIVHLLKDWLCYSILELLLLLLFYTWNYEYLNIQYINLLVIVIIILFTKLKMYEGKFIAFLLLYDLKCGLNK